MASVGVFRVDLTADVYTVAHTFDTADTVETLIAKPAWGRLAVVKVIANIPTGLTSPTATILDGATEIGKQALTANDIAELLGHANGLTIDGDLRGSVSDTAISVSAWCYYKRG